MDNTYHKQDPKTSTKNVLRNVGIRPGGVDGSPPVHELLDGRIRVEHNHDLGPQHEREDRSILARPLLKLEMTLLAGDLVQVPDDGERGRAGREVLGTAAQLADLEEAVDEEGAQREEEDGPGEKHDGQNVFLSILGRKAISQRAS